MATSLADDQMTVARMGSALRVSAARHLRSFSFAASVIGALLANDGARADDAGAQASDSARPQATAPTVARPSAVAASPMAAPAPAVIAAVPNPSCLPKTFSFRTGGSMERTADHIVRRLGLKVLAIGSSSTEGVGASAPAKSYPAQLAVDLADRLRGQKIDVRNAGIGGETIDRTIVRLEQELDRYQPDLVLWQVGTNDAITAGNSEDRFRSSVEAGIRQASRHRADMVLIDPQYFPKIKDVPRYERYVDIVRATAETNGVGLFPRYRLMRAIDQEPGGIEPLLGPDSFHMGDRGYACIAGLLADQIVLSVARTAHAH